MDEKGSDNRIRRGWLSFYGLAFVALLIAAGCMAYSARGLLQSLAPLRASIAMSAVAIVLAALGLWLPRRG